MSRRRIAIVTPWYGPEATGGAETLARELASNLAASDDVTILTTTARSFQFSWSEDHFQAGRSKDNGYDVLRFRLGHRNDERFHRLNGELLGMPRAEWSGFIQQRALMDPFIDESINSPALEQYLKSREAAKYDAVVFLPYLYGVVVRGMEAFPGRAHLLPCLHDEVYARLPRVEDAIHRADSLLFNSEGEAELALRIYGPGIIRKSHVIGSGIAPRVNGVAAAVVNGEYFLYLGRRDATKGVDFLIDAFAQYRRNGSSAFSLVLAGPGTTSYTDPERGIIDLGFVDEGTKHTLIRRARALAQPSINESYSRVIMEAWREEIPVVARAGCLATVTAVERSGAGLIADGLEGWAAALSRLASARSDELETFGRCGSAYAAIHADWSQVIGRFREATGLASPASLPRRRKRVDQIVETLTYGDAISDYARALQAHLQRQGYESVIYALFIHPRVSGQGHILTAKALAASDVLIYHHSIEFGELSAILSAPGSKALVYHNITPSRFFRDYDVEFADVLERGRAQLAQLNGALTACGADSEFNAQELRELGFEHVTVIPVPVDFARFDVTPAPIPDARTATEWLFVGRISPNKGIGALIEAFEAYLCLDASARLVLVGAYDIADRYLQELTKMVSLRGLDRHVVFAGVVDEANLTARYRNADLFVCLSEHEGFCVPLVEAMYFDLPIVARAGTAIVETMGDSGILVDAGADRFEIASVAHAILTDDGLRERVINSQRRRREAFLPKQILPMVDAFIADLA